MAHTHQDPAHALAAERLGARGARFGAVALAIGLAAFALALWLGYARDDGWRRWQHAWLVASVFVLSLSLGGLFFVLIQHLTGASWSVVVRRIAEITAANTAVAALFLAPLVAFVVLGDGSLYPWADARTVAEEPLLQAKAAFLDGRFFALRCAIYFATWWLLGRWLLRRSLAQGVRSDVDVTSQLQRRAAPAMVAFAVTTCLAGFDLLMSLSPAWYSTIFGVYFFAGCVVAFFASTVLILRALQARGLLARSVTVEHYHDLGKFLFAFVFFWSYIAFSQFMLIWYADLPEETVWFHQRLHGSWRVASFVLLAGHFALPMAGLLSRHAKRNLRVLTFWCVWMLVMHALDLFWIVLPGAEPEGAHVLGLDAACLVAALGVWIFAWTRIAAQRPLVATGDPRLAESLTFENV